MRATCLKQNFAHRKVCKFLNVVSDQALKEHIVKLEDYPLTLSDMDTEIIRGLNSTFRLRVGYYRIISYVGKPKQQFMSTDKSEKEKRNKINNNFFIELYVN